MSSHQFEKVYPFDVHIIYTEHQNGYRYDIIIDNATVDMYNITAMTYADEDERQMCPTIGIFDEFPFHLKPGVIDKLHGFYKGIQLSGTTSQKQDIRLYIQYSKDVKNSEVIKKIIEVKCNEIR